MAYKRILVPVDGSPTSGLGLREAIAFAKAQKAILAKAAAGSGVS